MTQTTRIATLAALTALALSASAIVRLDTKKDDDYLTFGKTFSAVGKLTGKDGFGSGTLIHAEWVLTAAHVIKEDAGKVTDFMFNLNGAEFGVEKVVYNDARPWDKDKKGEGRDIALVKLTKKVADTNPAKLYAGKWDNATLFAAEAAFAGFGNIGDGKTGAVNNSFDGKRRAATNAIDAIDLKDPIKNEFIITNTFMVDFDNGEEANNTMAKFEPLGGNKSSRTPTALEGSTASGDSGGGFFIKVGDEWHVAGVNEAVNESVYGAIPFFTALRDHREWVVATVPEPGTLVAVGLGLAALARRRRSR